jgi:hypothetical protein
MLWARRRGPVPGSHSANPHTRLSVNKITASLIRELEMIEAMVPDELEVVREVLSWPEVIRGGVAGQRQRGGGAPRVGQYWDRASGVKINMLPAEGVLEVDFRAPAGIASRGAGQSEGDRARYPMVTVEELLAGNPELTWFDPTQEMVGHLVGRWKKWAGRSDAVLGSGQKCHQGKGGN